MNEAAIKEIVATVIAGIQTGGALPGTPRDVIPVEVSARHVHLSQNDVERLFGPGHTLTSKRPLSQPGQFLAEERVSIVTAKGEFRNVAVLGPARTATQVELSMTDARSLGLNAPVRQSGDVKGSPDICIFSKDAMIQAKESVIVAQNHIHMTPQDAAAYGVRDGQHVTVKMNTARPIEFKDVVIRVSDNFALTMHIDFDEANACAFTNSDTGTLSA